jgi:glutamate dehydrogenase
MVLFDELLKGTLIDEAYVAQALAAYFPRQIRERYADALPGHPLKREIVATVVANGMINRVGSVFVHRMQEETGASMEDVVRAFVLVRDIFGLDSLWAQMDGLDNRVPTALQSELFIEAGRLVLRATLWFLRRRRERLPIARVIAIFQPAVKVFGECLPGILAPDDRASWDASVKRLAAEGVAEPLARRLASLGALYAVLDATEVAQGEKRPVESVASLYFALAGDLELRWVGERITALPTDTSWQALARNALRDDLAAQQRALTAAVVKLSPEGAAPPAMLAAWKERYAQPLARLAAMREELKRAGNLDLAVLSVLLRELRALA